MAFNHGYVSYLALCISPMFRN